MAIPGPESITIEWLTEALHGAGHAGVSVTGFEKSRIGTGQIGACYRLALELDGAEPEVPSTLVAKFASDDPTSRQTGVALRNFYKEVRFYQVLQPHLSIRTPLCYYAEIDGEGPEFALLLEDLAPAKQGDQLTGTNPDTARTAVLELVGLHAPAWNDPQLLGHDFLGPSKATAPQATGHLYLEVLDGFLERYGSALDRDQQAIIAAYGRALAQGSDDDKGPRTLVHVDYRLDNLLIDSSTRPPVITVVDWQSITVGKPMGDVAYFIGAGLLPEARSEVEEDLVRNYHEVLTAELERAGHTAYGWDDCWQDYRRGAFAGFSVTVVASMIVQRTERGDRMFTAMADRYSRHALDLDAWEFLT